MSRLSHLPHRLKALFRGDQEAPELIADGGNWSGEDIGREVIDGDRYAGMAEHLREDRSRIWVCREDEIRAELLKIRQKHPHTVLVREAHGHLHSVGITVVMLRDMAFDSRHPEHGTPEALVYPAHPSYVKIIEELLKGALNAHRLKLFLDSLSWNIMALTAIYVNTESSHRLTSIRG